MHDTLHHMMDVVGYKNFDRYFKTMCINLILQCTLGIFGRLSFLVTTEFKHMLLITYLINASTSTCALWKIFGNKNKTCL